MKPLPKPPKSARTSPLVGQPATAAALIDVAITQAICDFRRSRRITGRLFLGAGPQHLQRVLEEAQGIVDAAVSNPCGSGAG